MIREYISVFIAQRNSHKEVARDISLNHADLDIDVCFADNDVCSGHQTWICPSPEALRSSPSSKCGSDAAPT